MGLRGKLKKTVSYIKGSHTFLFFQLRDKVVIEHYF